MLRICLITRPWTALVRKVSVGATALVLSASLWPAAAPEFGAVPAAEVRAADQPTDSMVEAAPEAEASVVAEAAAEVPAEIVAGTMAGLAAEAAVAEPGDEYRPRSDGLVVHGRALMLLDSNQSQARAVGLGEEDAQRYRRIFELQGRADWDGADREVARLRDRRLLGHVLRQRYLHPSSPRVAYDELRLWLKRYGDQAGAERIYALALARQPRGAVALPEPADLERLNGSLEERAAWGGGVAPRSRSEGTRAVEGPTSDRIEGYLRAGKLAAALKVLGDDGQTSRLDSVSYDRLRARVATALFFNGSSRTALSLAAASAARSGASVPNAHWIAGLVLWRRGDFAMAGRHFEAMAGAGSLSPWEAAAAAFWVARTWERLGRPERAERWLDRAARYDRTFYGLIARRALGRSATFQWQVPPLTVRHLTAIADTPQGYRALALLQVGQDDLAEQELRRVHPRDNALLAEALVALADDAGLPALALQVGNVVASPDGGAYDAALYPLPHWTPPDGFTLDRALLFAIMRQESRFEPRLTSRAGATGVMQLMPETAHDVGDGVDYSGVGRRLFDPQWNLMLGQRYVASLLGSPQIGGNLVHLTAAYNAGPANLLRWRHDLEDIGDPLLFIECIPMRETRDYVHKVLTNYWIYQARLGQPSTSLDALAAGSPPVYVTPADRATQVAVRDEN